MKYGLGLLLILGAFLSSALAADSAEPRPGLEGIYVHTYGDPKNPPIVFVHGGPGFDSWTFEETSAQPIANKGFYVVVYDRRGEGRSDYTGQKDYGFNQASKDLRTLIDRLGLKSPVIVGHSFGGPIVERFEENNPGVARKIVLVSGTIDNWATVHSTFENCVRYLKGKPDQLAELHQVYDELFEYEKPCPSVKAKRTKQEDSPNCDDCRNTTPQTQFLHDGDEKSISKIGAALGSVCNSKLPPLELVNKASAYEGTCHVYDGFPHAGAAEADALLRDHPLQGEKPHGDATAGYYQDPDSFIRFNGVPYVAAHAKRFCGIYGDHDGLFTPAAIAKLGAAFKVDVVPSGHNVFLDQNRDFLKMMRETCGF